MTNPDDKIKEVRQRLDELGIKTDRDLVKHLGIKPEDKNKLYTWIEYQGAFYFKDGYNKGQNDLKEALKELLSIGE